MTFLLGFKTEKQPFEFVFPRKDAFDGEAGRVGNIIEETFSAPFGLFAVARVFSNVGFHSGVEDVLAIGFAVKARIQVECRTFDLNPGIRRHLLEVFQAIRQQNDVGFVDRRNRQWRQDVAVVIGNCNHLFARLVLVAAVADSVAPFLATVFEPSP